MKQQSFTSQELFCMARLAGKRRLFGIPDGFSGIDQDDRHAVIQIFTEKLVESQIAEMDFDGKISLRSEYRDIPAIYCDCEKCLTVNQQKQDGSSDAAIFWKYSGKFYKAEIIGDKYSIMPCDIFEVQALCSEVPMQKISSENVPETTIPQIALTKAKRFADSGDEEACIRVLRQNGADQRIARVLTSGLQEKADYQALILMENTGAEVVITSTNRIQSQGILLTTDSTSVNFRTCIVFKPIDASEMKAREMSLIEAFLQN